LANTPPDPRKNVGFLYWGVEILLLFLVGMMTAFAPEDSLWVWDLVFLSITALLVVFFAAIGKSLTGRKLGIFINGRNRIDLSRFQVVLWTLLILPAYATIALERIRWLPLPPLPGNDPLQITMDPRLWALLGISATSLVGTTLTSSEKKKKEPENKVFKQMEDKLRIRVEEQLQRPTEVEKIEILSKQRIAGLAAPDENRQAEIREQVRKDRLNEVLKQSARPLKEAETLRQGLLAGNGSVDDAKFSNIFEADEVSGLNVTAAGNQTSIGSYIDISKVQMFFFTIIAICTYAVLLMNQFAQVLPASMDSFPALSDGLVAILGISHAGFLGNNAVDHTPHT